MGHAQCGGIAAAINPEAAHGIPYVNEWVELAKPAVAHARNHSDNTEVEREAVKLSVARLLEYPFIAERVKAGSLAVDGARFGIANGVLEVLDQKTGTFEPVKVKRFGFF
jgi:carbonic anhydrase